jgi:hypothetical protein
MNGLAPEILAVLNVFDAIVSTAVVASLFCAVIAAVDARAVRAALTTPRGLLKAYFASFVRLWPFLIGYGIPIGLVSYVAGYLTSVSRAPAVGSILPAALALIGGLNIYVFGTEAKHKALIAYCVSLFMVVLIYGIQRGTYVRESDREDRLVALTQQEIRIRTLRENLGLDQNPPPWLLSTEPH